MLEREDRNLPISSPDGGGHISKPVWFAVFLGILIVCSFSAVIMGWGSFYTRDFSYFGYPLASHVQQSYRAGEFPLWNPYNYAGIPFLAQWNTMALYPLSILYVIFPLPWSLNLFVLLHLWGAGVGMYFFVRRLFQDTDAAMVAGTAYTFSGLLLTSLMWPNNIAALAWLPVILWLVPPAVLTSGKPIWPAALVIAVQILTGAPELILMTFGSLSLLVLAESKNAAQSRRGIAVRLATVFALAAALSAAQWIPFLELLRNSQRNHAYDPATWNLNWSGFGNFVVPLFHTIQSRDGIFYQPNQQWITSYYPGATVLFLVVLCFQKERSPAVKTLGLVVVISCWIALGPAGGLYSLLRRLLPFVGAMRFPIKCIVPALIALPLLAGLGARAVLVDRKVRPIITAALIVIGFWTMAMLAAWVSPLPGNKSSHIWSSGFMTLTFLVVLVLFCLPFARTPKRPVFFSIAIALLVYGDVFSALQSINPVAPMRVMRERAINMEPEPRLGFSRAMLSAKGMDLIDEAVFSDMNSSILFPRKSLALNANLIARIPKLDGFFSLYTPGFESLALRLMKEGYSNNLPLLKFLSVSQISRPAEPWSWERRDGYAGYLSIVSNVRPAFEPEIIRNLFGTEFDPGKFAYATPESFGRIGVDGTGTGEVFEQKFSRNRIEATVEVHTAPVLLVIAQQDFPGWQVSINRRRELLSRVNGFFQGVRLQPGQNKIVLEFRSQTFLLGAVLSISSLVFCLGLWISSFARRIRTNDRAHLQDQVSA